MGVVVASALIVATPPTAAHAHDQVLSTTPSSKEHLAGAPPEVSMVFTDNILEIGATILVVDDAGDNWVSGDMRVEGPQASQSLDADMPDGRYQVRWRVVSADGHPISGTFDFAVGEVTAATAAPAAKDATGSATKGAAGTTQRAEPGLDDSADSAVDRNAPAAPPFLLIGVGGALLGIVVFVLFTVLRPRRRAADNTRD